MKRELLKIVVVTYIDMLRNNLLNDNGVESFKGWCEEGDIFYNSLPQEDAKVCVEIMNKLARHIDTLTYAIEEV